MSQKWLICVTALVLVKRITAAKAPNAPVRPDETHLALPLTKSLGIPKPKLNKNLEDRRLGQEYIEQYQEMMRASQESFENFEEREDKRLRRVIGDDDLELMAEAGGMPRRRSADKLQSVVGKRRARSQAVRRDKLNVQGLKSHKLHSKHTNLEYVYD